jgi:hypothetical protein
MKRFRLNLVVLLCSIIGLSAIATWLFLSGRVPEGIFAVIAVAISVVGVMVLVRKLVLVMSVFVKSLEMNDTTARFDIGNDDPLLREMSASMSRIVDIYRSNSRQLETRKLYYDRILKIMTHEMRNSITPVISISSDMEKHPEKYEGENLTEALGVIRSQSEGVKRFLDSYYRLTHLPQPETEAIDATLFFERVKTLVAVEVKERGLSPDVCRYAVGKGMTLNIDVSLMSQVMVNLVRNALDAVAGVESPSVIVTATLSDRHPYISIEDNGAGISPEIRDMLFQPFVTTKSGGSGVGLSLSRQIVRLHGGDLRLTGSSGHGAKAVIILI